MELGGHSSDSVADAAPLPGCKVLYIGEAGIPKTAVFRYLGSIIAIDNTLGVAKDVARRISLAHAAFGALRHVWRSSQLSRHLKAGMLLSCVASVLLFGSESWNLDARMLQSLQRTWQYFVRHALGLTYQAMIAQRVSFAEQLELLQVPSVMTLLQRRLAGWLGHIARMSPERITRMMLFGTLRNRRSPPSATSALRITYYSRIHGLVSQLPGVDVRIWARVAEDKVAWARMIRAISIVPQTRGTAVDARHRLRVQDRPRTHGLTCPVPGCGYTSTNQQGLQRHINAKHGQAPQQSWTCASCERVFYHKGAFTLHLKSCGKSPEP